MQIAALGPAETVRTQAYSQGAIMSASRLYQVNEEDLCELERVLPQLAESLTPILDGRLRVQLRRCQSILSNVRWGYGPPSHVERIDADQEFDS
jgi:hypothetical protein